MNYSFSDKIEEVKIIAEKYNLDLVMLFGSYAKNRQTKESDIDIGVYRRDDVNYDMRINLISEFSNALGTDNVDIQVISSHSPVLMYSILKDGKVLYQREEGLYMGMKLYAWKLYADSQSFRDRAFAITKKRILSM